MREIHRWLSAPDPSTNHNAASKKRRLQTGSWLIESQEFTHWKRVSASYLWLHGIPGCGKTILTSTIIQDIRHTCLDRPGSAYAYFYFNFNEDPRCDLMLRSLLMQLSKFSTDMSQHLETLHLSCRDGLQQPNMDSLMTILHEMIKAAGETFIVLDALDECGNRDELLDCLSAIDTWKLGSLHLLFTSRKEPDILDCISEFVTDDKILSIQNAPVNQDIRAYVRDRLQTNRKLRRWRQDLDIQQEVEATLMDKAGGMYDPIHASKAENARGEADPCI